MSDKEERSPKGGDQQPREDEEPPVADTGSTGNQRRDADSGENQDETNKRQAHSQ